MKGHLGAVPIIVKVWEWSHCLKKLLGIMRYQVVTPHLDRIFIIL